ncbi:MAG: hypothetical protein WA175_13905 [Candidatus Acidiferrales bacterium]
MVHETVCLEISGSFTKLKARAAATALILAGLFVAFPLAAQEQQGPLPLPPAQPEYPAPQPPSPPSPPPQPAPPKAAPELKRASTDISKDPPAIPADQIIAQFAAHEAEFKVERDNFTYSQTFVIQTIDDSGQPDGEYRLDSDVTFTPSGQRYENITYAPQPTLERIMLTEQDFDDLKNIQPFVLTTTELPKYNITYVGREQLDDIGTYVFDVAPKTIEKDQRYFQGRVWVDDKELEIIKTYGKAVPDIIKGKNANMFPRFETYRENIEGHFWFPTYTHADDDLHFPSGDVHIRMTVHYSDYKRFRSTIRLLPTPQNKP